MTYLTRLVVAALLVSTTITSIVAQTDVTLTPISKPLDTLRVTKARKIASVPFSSLRVATGILTNTVFNHPAELSMQVIASDSLRSSGGAFLGPQAGTTVRAWFALDSMSMVRYMVGFDFIHFNGPERRSYLPASLSQLHSSNLFTPTIGLEYGFLYLPLAQTTLFVGGEVRGNFFTKDNYRRTLDYTDPKLSDTTDEQSSKPAAFRLGGTIKIGAEGSISEPLRVHASVGISIANLLFRNDRYGELLTLSSIPREPQESLLPLIQVAILLQYRLPNF